MGIGAGYVGSFMVLKRMSLVGDALSHVALPGIALAFLWHANPYLGAFATLFLAIIVIWRLERNTALPTETLVGILFTFSLAVGLLITPKPELLEALFGDISKVTPNDLLLSLIAVIVIVIVMKKITHRIMLNIISPDLAQSSGISSSKINFTFLILVAIVVTLGLKVVGTLLMGSLVIIPAAAAKNMASSLSRYTILASSLGGLSAVIGILLAHSLGLQPGPLVVLASSGFFAISLILKK